MKNHIISLFITMLVTTACSDFLDLKPDKKMDIPKTLEDCDLLLNDFSVLNMGFASANLVAGEEFFLHSDDWRATYDPDEKNTYIWSDEPLMTNVAWQGPYRVVFVANQLLSIVDALPDAEKTSVRGLNIRGEALFFRAFAYQQLAEMFCLGYDPDNAKSEFGLPLKFTPDPDLPDGRASLEETYQQIISDYKTACQFLALTSVARSRPGKASAYGGLARLYLDMRDFENAFLYADSAWMLQPDLLDYNLLDAQKDMSIPRDNGEILFKAFTYYADILSPFSARINPDLMDLYIPGDRRREIYFQHNSFDPGTYGYKTNYDQNSAGSYIGLTTSEILLIRAESAIRTGRADQAIQDLNLLRKHRFDPQDYRDVQEDGVALLAEILNERRRELVFRGRRWADLKRLNKDADRSIEPKRIVDGQNYELKANSLRYAFLIPQTVLDINPSILQNKR